MRIVVLSTYFQSTMSVSLLSAALMYRLADLPEVGGRGNVAHVAGICTGPQTEVDGFPVTPLGSNGMGRPGADIGVIAREVLAYGPDLVIVIIDARYVPGLAKLLAPVPVWFWMPIDSNPMSPRDLPAIDGCARAISMSRFGLDQLALAGVEKRAYIPAPLDPAFCVDADPALRAAVRASMGGPGCEHLTVIVGRYHVGPAGDRKAYAQQLRAWAEFAEDKPGARLYIHVPAEDDGRDDGQRGVYEMVREFGLAGRVRFPRNMTIANGAPVEQMAQQYNAADVLLHATAAEGFGMPITEAQACGCPVVVTDWTAMPELVRWGYAVRPLDVQYVPVVRSWWAWVDVEGTTRALQRVYDAWRANGDRWPLEERRAVAAAVREEYSWDSVFARQWLPLLRG